MRMLLACWIVVSGLSFAEPQIPGSHGDNTAPVAEEGNQRRTETREDRYQRVFTQSLNACMTGRPSFPSQAGVGQGGQSSNADLSSLGVNY